ncbi:MAG TPA: hypothetical protein VF679_07520 [Pedobacter sp.]|jgi:hypothetical protein
MAFKKGQKPPPGAGRPKGSLSKKKILKVDEVLALSDFNPTQKLLDMYATMDDEQKIRVLCFLITYSQAKPVEQEQPSDLNKEATEKLAEVPSEDLKALITYEIKDAK